MTITMNRDDEPTHEPPSSTALGSRDPKPGTEIGRFVVLGHLGEGGMGVLYVAYDPELDRKVALKLVRAKGHHRAESADLRQLREAQALARFSHPNIVSVYEVGTFEDQVFLALEYIEGANLEDWVRDENPSVRDTIRIFAEAGRGLAAAHDAGILHRDIKPQNIMVGPGSRARLVDFGLARASDHVELNPSASAERPSGTEKAPAAGLSKGISGGSANLSSSMTRPGSVIGTPTYMAPELMDESDADERTDQYGFCASLYNALYGHPPHAIKTFADLLKVGKQTIDLPARGRNQSIPTWIRAVLARGLDTDPDNRFDSMAALVNALEQDPEAIFKHWLVAAAGLILAVGATTGLVTWAQDERTTCDTERTRLAEIWNPDQRHSLGQAFDALDSSFATASRRMVENGLDDYAQSWQNAFLDACRATYVHREQSEELFDLRNRCLVDRLREFDALIGVLEDVDQELLERAPRAVSDLPSIAPCSRVEDLRSIKAPPLAPETQQRLEQARDTLATVKAHHMAARFDTADRLIEMLLAPAKHGKLPGLEAEIFHQVGRLHASQGRYELARQHHIEALTSALANRQDELAVETLTDLAWVEGNYQGHTKLGFEWLNMARALADRLGDRPALEAKLVRDRASLSFNAGDYRAAERAFRESLLLLDNVDWQHTSGETAFTRIRGSVQMNLAVVLRVTGKPTESLEYYDAAIEAFSSVFGEDHPRVAETRFNRGSALAELGRTEEAEAELRLSLKQLRSSLGDRHPRIGVPLNNLGVIYEGKGRLDEAIAFYRDALSVFQQAYPDGHFETARTLRNLAEAHLLRDNTGQARDLAEQALDMARSVGGGDHPETVGPMDLIARLDLLDGLPERVIEPMERALKITQGESNHALRSGFLFNLARALWDSRLDRPRALESAREALDLIDQDPLYAQPATEIRRWLERRRQLGTSG